MNIWLVVWNIPLTGRLPCLPPRRAGSRFNPYSTLCAKESEKVMLWNFWNRLFSTFPEISAVDYHPIIIPK